MIRGAQRLMAHTELHADVVPGFAGVREEIQLVSGTGSGESAVETAARKEANGFPGRNENAWSGASGEGGRRRINTFFDAVGAVRLARVDNGDNRIT